MHYVSSYPTKDIDLNLLSIKFLKNNTNFEIFFRSFKWNSWLWDGSYSVIENTFDKKGDKKVGDFSVSISPDKFKVMVNNIRKIESILGKYEKKCFKVEKKIERKLEDQFIQLKNSEKSKIDTTNTICLRPLIKRD